ncbi:MAG: hypothetical protein NBV63_01570 [Candidatus Pacebacteria bacterium]|nr:hypothetical protein [Candidatus Paceibacterota bacterium]
MIGFQRTVFWWVSLTLIVLAPYGAYGAEDSITVSVTPPLFQLSISPGETWSSSLKIVNTNPYDVTYYTSVVNFQPSGEAGTGTFEPIIADFGTTSLSARTLAQWIDIAPDPVTATRGQSVEIPFTVRVPTDAEPGGHYAAVLVGTKPPAQTEAGSRVSVSSYVSSLFFVKVAGDVVEEARIREFVSDRAFYESPDARFLLRFENLGSVHVRPAGDIVIYNMWGKERGRVAINQKTTFGNVLPKSVRRYTFDWSTEFSPLDIGRYSATVTLVYGSDARKTVTATTYFWVVPVLPVAATVGGVISFLLFFSYLIRRYIRRVIELERVVHGTVDSVPVQEIARPLAAFTRPLQEGVVDLRRVALATEGELHQQRYTRDSDSRISASQFLARYKLFFVFLALCIVTILAVRWYFSDALNPTKPFQIEQTEGPEVEVR